MRIGRAWSGFLPPAQPFLFLFGCAVVLFLVMIESSVRILGSQQEPTSTPITDGFSGQPIAFSHRQHVGEFGLDCQLCHVYARRGPVAGIPSVARCVGCHQFVQPNQPEIQKLLAYWENQEPIPWVQIHNLPDHVRFTHKRHVLAGVICESCHGDVSQMDAADQVQPLTMGWCLSCHKEQQASIDCLTCHS